jgi:anti-sigma regulatory factor (Ser/Thr protein kinase)
VADVSSIGEARRAAMRLAVEAQLSETDAGRASIVATELATNLTRHAGSSGGAMLMAVDKSADANAVEITSIDTGPGMSDIARCFEDGFSTAGTPGNGMGAVRRLSDELDLFSASSGTVIWARIVAGEGPTARAKARPQTLPRSSGLSVPIAGESVCGDNWQLHRAENGQISMMIADGLGHGPLAAEASEAACRLFESRPLAEPVGTIEAMHGAIGGTRGAAVAIARIDPAAGKLVYAGVGNIAGTLLAPDGSSRGLFSHNGTVGHRMRKVQGFEYPWSPASLIVMHSDGLQTRWSFDNYPGLARRHPGVIGGVLYRDFRRGRDDVSVLVVGPPELLPKDS